MQATDYYGYLLVRAYYCLLLVTMITYWLGPVIVYCLLLWLLVRAYYGLLLVTMVTYWQRPIMVC